MDQIERIMLERINHPYMMMYWCDQQQNWVSIKQCGICPSLDTEGHCDYQGLLEEVKQ